MKRISKKMEVSKISNSEMEVMKIIWGAETAMTPKEVMEQAADKEWKYTTITTFLTRLVDKGLLECKKGRTNHYWARISESDYKRYETKDFLDTVHQGSVRSMLAALTDQDISEEALERLLQSLDQPEED